MANAASRVRSLPDRRPLGSLALAVLASIAVGSAGSVFTAMGLDPWYASLAKPAFTPPGWVFGPVWTLLFALMGVAAWLVWRQVTGQRGDAARIALAAFAGQYLLNLGWSAAFFGLQSVLLGLVEIVVLWLAIVATVALFARVDRRAAALLLPYLAWVSFATVLNYAIWTLN